MAIESPLGIITVTLAQFMQTVFLVMIVVEVFRLFGSFGRSKEGSQVADGFKALGNKINEKLDKRSERRAADREKKLQEAKALEEQEFKLGKDIASLSLSGKSDVEKLKNGCNTVKEVLNRPNYNDLVKDLKTRVVENMLVISSNLERKAIVMRRATQKNQRILKEWDTKIKDFVSNSTSKEANEKLNRVYIMQKRLVDSKQNTDENPKWRFTKRFEEKYKQQIKVLEIYENDVKVHSAQIHQSIKDINEKDQKLVIVDRKIVTLLRTINTDITGVRNMLVELEKKNLSPMDQGMKLETIAKTIQKLNTDINYFENGWNQLSHANSSLLNEYEKNVRQPYGQLLVLTRNLKQNLHDIEEHFKNRN